MSSYIHILTPSANYLQLLYLRFQLASLVASNRTSNNWSRDSTCPTKGLLRWNKNVWNILQSYETGHFQLRWQHEVYNATSETIKIYTIFKIGLQMHSNIHDILNRPAKALTCIRITSGKKIATESSNELQRASIHTTTKLEVSTKIIYIENYILELWYVLYHVIECIGVLITLSCNKWHPLAPPNLSFLYKLEPFHILKLKSISQTSYLSFRSITPLFLVHILCSFTNISKTERMAN